MTSLHILMVVPGFPRDENDSSCIPAMQMYIRYLAELTDHQITIITLSYPKDHHHYKWHDLQIHALYSSLVWPLNKIQSGRKALVLAKSIHRECPIHFVHSFWLSDTALIGALISRQLQIPHLTTLMGQDVRKSNRYRALSSFFRLHLVALTNYQASFLPERLRKSIYSVIGWGVENNYDSDATRTIDILGVGSLTQNKDYKNFIEMIAELRDEFPKVKVVIIGDGVEKNNLNRLIRSCDLEDNITMMGHRSREEVLLHMSRSRLFLHTSKFEGYGYVFGEALASGCHIVSRRVGLAADLELERWSVGETKSDLVRLLSLKLKGQLNHRPVVVKDVKQTVHSYCDLYQSMSASGGVSDESLS